MSNEMEDWKKTTPDANDYSHGFHIFMDGNMWCAVGPAFRDLQQDHAGFGGSPTDAFDAWWDANKLLTRWRRIAKPDFSRFTIHAATETTPKERWRGIGKLVEECGEVLQLLGKTIAFPTGDHPDGKGTLRERLPEELSDLKAAIEYFEDQNELRVNVARTARKLALFQEWGLTGVHDLRPAPIDELVGSNSRP